jgi:hypothetical protein
VPTVAGRKAVPARRAGHHPGYHPGYLHNHAGDQQSATARAQRNYQRYVALAHEAGLKGDAIAAENFFQHAEHFYRMLRDAQR